MSSVFISGVTVGMIMMGLMVYFCNQAVGKAVTAGDYFTLGDKWYYCKEAKVHLTQ